MNILNRYLIIGILVGLMVGLSLILIVAPPVSAADEWVSPVSHETSNWIEEEKSYDENTLLYSKFDIIPYGWSPWLPLNLDDDYESTKLRVWSSREASSVTEVNIEVYSSCGWIEVYDGDLVVGSFVEYDYSERVVSRVRIRYSNTAIPYRYAYCNEVDVWFGFAEEVEEIAGGGFGGWMIALMFCIVGLGWYTKSLLLGIVGAVLCTVSYVWVGGFSGDEIGVYGSSAFFLIILGWIVLNLIWREAHG